MYCIVEIPLLYFCCAWNAVGLNLQVYINAMTILCLREPGTNLSCRSLLPSRTKYVLLSMTLHYNIDAAQRGTFM